MGFWREEKISPDCWNGVFLKQFAWANPHRTWLARANFLFARANPSQKLVRLSELQFAQANPFQRFIRLSHSPSSLDPSWFGPARSSELIFARVNPPRMLFARTNPPVRSSKLYRITGLFPNMIKMLFKGPVRLVWSPNMIWRNKRCYMKIDLEKNPNSGDLLRIMSLPICIGNSNVSNLPEYQAMSFNRHTRPLYLVFKSWTGNMRGSIVSAFIEFHTFSTVFVY